MTERGPRTRGRPSRRTLTAFLVALSAMGCGAGTPTGTMLEAAPSVRLSWEPGAFSLTLADGVRLGMDASGAILRDGVVTARLEPDGRVVGLHGESIAALLADGQLSHRGELSAVRILDELPSILAGGRETLARERGRDTVVLVEDRLRVRRGRRSGEARVAFSSPGTTRVRPLVVLVVILELLEHGHMLRIDALRGEGPDAGAADGGAR